MSDEKEVFLAFPLTFDDPTNAQRYVHTGMTLRDYFAAKAMQSILTRHYMTTELSEDVANIVSTSAFKIADTMMKVRDESE